MLDRYSAPFLEYAKLANFSGRSIEAFSARLNEFNNYLKSCSIRAIKRVEYEHIVEFCANFQSPSIHVTKSRVWMLRQFYHFLTLHGHVPKNIARNLPYPKIEKTVPMFLTEGELTRLIHYFSRQPMDMLGLRNLVMILLLGFLGLRTATLIAVNIEDLDLTSGLLWVKDKGRISRSMILPHSVCKIIRHYLRVVYRKTGPFFITKNEKRISARTLQDIFKTAADCVGIEKKLRHQSRRGRGSQRRSKMGCGYCRSISALPRGCWSKRPTSWALSLPVKPYLRIAASAFVWLPAGNRASSRLMVMLISPSFRCSSTSSASLSTSCRRRHTKLL
jgi:site-specific recombinase XerD